jgi:hypothetical protein
MNKLLIFGSSIVAAMGSEAGPAAERKLADAFDGAAFRGATAGQGSAISGACNFRTTAELFAHTWETTEYSANGVFQINSDDTLDEDGGANTNIVGQVTNADWQAEDVKLARFTVAVKLTNYNALAVDQNTKNYAYYDFDGSSGASGNGNGWSATNLDNSGEEAMVAVCVCKPGHDEQGDQKSTCDTGADGACEENDQIVNVLPGAQAGVAGTAVDLDFGIRKILGVASLCGVSGDKHSGHTGAEDDIFVWAALQATDSMTFQVTYEATSDDSALASAIALSNAAASEDTITYTLTIATDKPATYDLLYVEEPNFYEQQTLFTNAAGALHDSDSHYRIDYHDGHQASGGVTITTADASMSCETSLTVRAEDANHWKCFRNAAAKNLPNGNGDLKDADALDELTALTSSSSFTAVGDTGAGSLTGQSCAAKIDIVCTSGSSSVSGVDARVCQVTQANLNGNALNQGSTDSAQDFDDCIENSWFTGVHSYYQDESTFDGTFDAVIVQAVRLRANRAYPKGADTMSDGTAARDATNGFPTSAAAGERTWECDANNCASEDPYVVLSSGTGGLEYKYDSTGLGPFKTCADDSSCDTSNHLGTCIGGTIANSGTASQTCSRSAYTTMSTDAIDGDGSYTESGTDAGGDRALSYSSGFKALEAPPAGFPETYVFGIASFAFDTDNDGDHTDNVNVIRTPDTADNQGTDYDASGSRRLRAVGSKGLNQKTFFVNALSNVFNK